MMEFFSEQVCRRKQDAFGDAAALRRYRFEHDNGRVPQLEQARRYAAQWKQMREQNLGLLFWGKPGNGKTFAAAIMMGGKGKMGGMMKNLMKSAGGAKGGMPDMSAMMKSQGGMPDMSALMGEGGMPDMSKMPDLSALMGGGARPKMPKGMGAFNGLFRRR